MLLLDQARDGADAERAAAGPDLGVIEEARRRRRRRHVRVMLASLALAALVGGLVWSLSTGSSHAAAGTRDRSAGGANATHSSGPLDFDIRLAPTLTVGIAGWCEVPEEHGRVSGSACGGLPVSSQPLLDAFGWSNSQHKGVEYVIADPRVAAVLVGKRRAPTESLPGLPYGLRAARVETSTGFPHGRLVPLDASGHPLSSAPSTPQTSQATIRSWLGPAREPRGVCSLHAPTRVPGLHVLGGEVSLALLPFPGPIVGHAFLPCATSEYRLHGEPLSAFVLVDAADPTGSAAALPDFHPLRQRRSLFAEGGLAARRYGNGWIVVKQGRGPRQRLLLLEHLTATTPAG